MSLGGCVLVLQDLSTNTKVEFPIDDLDEVVETLGKALTVLFGYPIALERAEPCGACKERYDIENKKWEKESEKLALLDFLRYMGKEDQPELVDKFLSQ